MCGFAGFFGTGEYDREKVVSAMSERIKHRGPDADGTFVDDYVALGFRRLSIIDLAYGMQPMHSADGRYVICFNGEIYNFKDIRKKLEKKRFVHYDPLRAIQENAQALQSQTLSYADYYARYHTTEPRDGWRMANPTGNKVIYVKNL